MLQQVWECEVVPNLRAKETEDGKTLIRHVLLLSMRKWANLNQPGKVHLVHGARASREQQAQIPRRSLRPFFMRQVYWQRGKHASTVNRARCLSFSLQDKIVLRYRTHGQVCAEGSSGRRVGWGPRMAELSGLKEKQGQIFPYSSGLALPTEALNQALAREVTAAGFFWCQTSARQIAECRTQWCSKTNRMPSSKHPYTLSKKLLKTVQCGTTCNCNVLMWHCWWHCWWLWRWWWPW